MRVHNSKVRLLQHTPVHIPSSTCTSFRFSPLNSFFVMHFSFTQARLRSGVRQVRARSPPYLYRCGNTNQPYTYTSSHHVYTAYIFDICVACCGASVCVSAVERGLLVRVPSSPRGGLLGGRRWSSRERTVASRRLDGERGRIVQHVTAILLGRERLRGCNLFFFPPTFHPGYSCVVPVGRKHLGVATFLIIHRWMSTNCASKRSLSLSFFYSSFFFFYYF